MGSIAAPFYAVNPHLLHRPRRPKPTTSRRRRPLVLTPAVAIPRRRARRLVLSPSASAAPPDRSVDDHLERCFLLSPDDSGGLRAEGPVMNAPFGSFSSTVQKSKIVLPKKTSKPPQTDTGGSGGDIGKRISHGGGDGGDDDGDDDDYFGDFDEEDGGEEGGLFRKRIVFKELFDRKFVDAVLQEWFRTMMNLPAGLRQAYEMGLISSVQLVRYFSIVARPTTSRFISRTLPGSQFSRAFIGRMIADPSFLYKMILETVATLSSSLWWEFKNRKERVKQEWDLVLVNVLTVTACNAFVVWSLAPCRSYGNTFRFDLQNSIQKLPNNVFEKSYPMREFDMPKRIQSLLYKAAQFSLVGTIAGYVQGTLSKKLAARKKSGVSMIVPSIGTSSLGYGAFLGLYANLRYQTLCGLDRAMFDYFDVLPIALSLSTLLRATNAYTGEASRLAWLGVESNPFVESELLMQPSNSPSDADTGPQLKWLISKDAIISTLGLLGIKQGGEDPESAHSKPRRKRTVKRKVVDSSVQ